MNTQQNFEQFRQYVLREVRLQENLRDILDTDEFLARVIESGRLDGFDFTVEDVREAMRKNQREWIERWI